VENYPYPVKEGQRYINLNPSRHQFTHNSVDAQCSITLADYY